MNNFIILERKATEFRRELGIGHIDPINFKSLLKKLNVITVFRPLGETFNGMAIKIVDTNKENTNRFMLVNNIHSLGEQNFTIGHELYHLFIQENFTHNYCTTGLFNKKHIEEFNADVFSSILMLPEDGIISLIPDMETQKDQITIQTILKLEQYFFCSRSVLLYRLKNLSLISESKSKEYLKDIVENAILNGYPLDLYKNGNSNLVLGDYGQKASELYSKELISESHYHSLLLDLGMNQEDLENLFNG
ncbi:Zn-dependent peptidase ImmA (M78 family) [Chryseobacterium sp. 7]|uniref:ImmA/IrrE family metallo-endopeptidase n=1 Tax=Chryseobacterium sp. 7 TaxID=2035214 RepID=UPI000EB38537|nr:ImmA/IrrE family metallo-endopeptidase [Chryseobacterium sp. 7]RLJ31169.1 Zn-dependent peptidase ImmA (M78 family) [Chryseobacterium sp. 7]